MNSAIDASGAFNAFDSVQSRCVPATVDRPLPRHGASASALRSPDVVVPAAALVVVALALVCGAGPALASGAGATDMPALVRLHETDRADLRRFHSIVVDPVRLERLESFARESLERLDRLDFDALDVDGRIDYVLLRNHLQRDLAQIADERRRLREIAPLVPFATIIVDLERRRSALEPIDARDAANALHAVRSEVDQLRSRLAATLPDAASDKGPVDAVTAVRAANAVDSLLSTLERWFRFHDGFKPDFSWWVRQPYAELVESLNTYRTLLREEIALQRGKPDDPLVGVPIGRAMLLTELAHEFVPYDPEELIAIAEREMAWCRAEMTAAAAALGHDDWRSALEAVKDRHVPAGQQDRLVAELAQEAIDFVDARDLVTVPPLARETWRLEMLSAERQRVLPFAAYGGQHMLVAYPTDEMDHERKIGSMRGNNRHFTRIVTPHELIPGHHLQGFVAARHNVHRRLFRTAFLLEGWALHWEMLLWDLGFATGPEDRLGMLFWRKHRCARIIVSLRFHLGETTTVEMIDFLVDEIGHERDGATAEVRRYVGDAYGPLYQVAYMIGGLQMRALHRELVGVGDMTERAFHDAVMHRNSIPIELIRASLRGELIDRDHAASWRFDDEVAQP